MQVKNLRKLLSECNSSSRGIEFAARPWYDLLGNMIHYADEGDKK